MKEPSAPVASSPVPAFLLKLWALLEDPSNSDVITWNWNGQNFCILDDQRFSKEILPRYFKHNNLSSFIRQLNMYGFRKVMSLESGLVQSDRGSTIEFHHPFFKQGQAELLENIKRKISSTVKSDDSMLSTDELQKVALELQDLKNVQSNMNTTFENMRRENQALWAEVSALRRKHSQQQKLLTKVFQFILGLMRGNIVLGPKRKRQLTLEPSQSPPPKYSRHSLQFPEEPQKEVPVSSQKLDNSSNSSSLQIHEIFSPDEGTSACTQAVKQTQDSTVHAATSTDAIINNDAVQDVAPADSLLQLQTLTDPDLVPSSFPGQEGLALNVVQVNSTEDTDSVINAILNENNSVSYDLLDREDMQDFLNCIDASLEELQNMLSRKKLNVDNDVIEELFKPDLSSSDISVTDAKSSIANELQENETNDLLSHSDAELNKDMQLMQYTRNPVLSLFDFPSNADGTISTNQPDLTTLGDEVYPGSSSLLEMQSNADLGNNSIKAEDFSGPQELPPIFVLSPVNKLIDEVTEAEPL
ncbi:heat shock factor protein 3-like [Gastrophryne carolinensis]